MTHFQYFSLDKSLFFTFSLFIFPTMDNTRIHCKFSNLLQIQIKLKTALIATAELICCRYNWDVPEPSRGCSGGE